MNVLKKSLLASAVALGSANSSCRTKYDGWYGI